MTEDTLTAIFVDVDDFCQSIQNEWHAYQKRNGRQRIRKSALSDSEILTIMVFFHLSNQRCFKHFYLRIISSFVKPIFPKTMSYPRIIVAMQSLGALFNAYLKSRLAQPTGISFIDSTSINVCHNRRIQRNRVFQNCARRGKSTMGWFYGFKLHLVISHEGDLLAFNVTTGDIDDRKPVKRLLQGIFGKVYGDKGYLSEELEKELAQTRVTLITNTRKNMKEKPLNWRDKAMLKKRFLIETVNDQLKNICQIEHTRHRSPINFAINLLAGLIAYTFLSKKPHANIDEV